MSSRKAPMCLKVGTSVPVHTGACFLNAPITAAQAIRQLTAHGGPCFLRDDSNKQDTLPTQDAIRDSFQALLLRADGVKAKPSTQGSLIATP